MKTNRDIINMHMNGTFGELSLPTQRAILSAMNESNTEAILEHKNQPSENKEDDENNIYSLIEIFTDNGEHSHWALVDHVHHKKLWSERPEECKAMGYPVFAPQEQLKQEKGVSDEKIREIFLDYCIRHGIYKDSDDILDWLLKNGLSLSSPLAVKKPLSEWISVEERLPQDNEKVIGYSEIYESSEAVVFKDKDFWMVNGSGELESFEFSDSVTHWQPLPSPPIP